MGVNWICWDVVWYWGFVNVLQSPNFRRFELNSEIGAVNERTSSKIVAALLNTQEVCVNSKLWYIDLYARDLTFCTAISLDCSSISFPFSTASVFFSVATFVPVEISANMISQASVFSVTATFCTANLSFRMASCSEASAIFCKPPLRRSHWNRQAMVTSCTLHFGGEYSYVFHS